jgi:hypothetical protein
VNFTTTTLCGAFQLVFIVVYFVVNSVWKLWIHSRVNFLACQTDIPSKKFLRWHIDITLYKEAVINYIIHSNLFEGRKYTTFKPQNGT